MSAALALLPGVAPAAPAEGTRRYLGTCRHDGCGRTVAVERDDGATVAYPDCPDGHGPIVARPVVGTYSSHHACNAACMFARGPCCECSCAGANHGGGYSL